MPHKCVICWKVFKGNTENLKEFSKMTPSTFNIFSKYLIPDSPEPISFKEAPHFCSSCCSLYLAQVHDRHLKLQRLQATNSITASKLCQVLQTINGKLPMETLVQTGIRTPESDRGAVRTQKIETVHKRIGQVSATTDPPTAIMCGTAEQLLPPSSSTKAAEESRGSDTDSNKLEYRDFQYEKLSVGYQCKSCDFRSFKREQSIFAHINRVHFDPPASIVESAPVALDYYGIPFEKLSPGPGFKCGMCEFQVTRKSKPSDLLHLHIRRAHLGEDVAEKRPRNQRKKHVQEDETNKIKYLADYSCTKLPDGSFKCDSCDYVTKRPLRAVLGHIRMKHATAATRKVYRKMFEVTPNKFQYYGLTAERTEDGTYLGGSCPYSTNAHMLMRHRLNEIHKKEKSRVCETCGKSLRSGYSLSAHRIIFHKKWDESTKQLCPNCAEDYPTKIHLSRHVQKMHRVHNKRPKVARDHICESCGQQFDSAPKIGYHRFKYHSKSTGPKGKFECETCGKIYATQSGLDTHMNHHTGKRQYACDICHMNFTQSFSVVRHKKVVHQQVSGE